MIAVVDLSSKLGDYQRPYLTVFKIERIPNLVVPSDVQSASIAHRAAVDAYREAFSQLRDFYGSSERSGDVGAVIDTYIVK